MMEEATSPHPDASIKHFEGMLAVSAKKKAKKKKPRGAAVKRSICLCLALLAGCGRWDYHKGYRQGVHDAHDFHVRLRFALEELVGVDEPLRDDKRSSAWNRGRLNGFIDETAKERPDGVPGQ